MDFESYEREIQPSSFNLILCARVLYYMYDRLEWAFDRLVNRLEKKAKLLVIHQSSTGLSQILRLCLGRHVNLPHECSMYHLRQVLEALAQKQPSLHFDIIYLDKYVNVTCLKNVNSNNKLHRETALSLLSFLLCKDMTEIDGKALEKLIVERLLPAVTFPMGTKSDECIMFQPTGILTVERH